MPRAPARSAFEPPSKAARPVPLLSLLFVALAALCLLLARVSSASGRVTASFRSPTSSANDVVHIFMAVFNPANYSSRPRNARAQQARFRATRGAILYTAELAYGDAPFMATDAGNPHHLQLRYADPATPAVVWAKENLLNLAVQRLLPRRVAALGFIDAEVSFENAGWAVDALAQIRDGRADVVQPYSVISYGGLEDWPSAGYERARLGAAFEAPQTLKEWFAEAKGGNEALVWVYSWSCWQRIGGAFFDKDLGTLNDITTFAAAVAPGYEELVFPRTSVPADFTQDFRDTVGAYVAAAWRGAGEPRVGYVPGRVFHEEHGSFHNRGYLSLRPALALYEPSRHVAYDAHGLLMPTAAMPRHIIESLAAYFAARREDDAYVASTLGIALGLTNVSLIQSRVLRGNTRAQGGGRAAAAKSAPGA